VGEVVRCDCGFEARAADEDGLVAAIQRHAWEAHGMPLSDEEALLLAFRAELDETALTTTSRNTPDRTDGKEEKK
jgi:predicted small metal-binding protein